MFNATFNNISVISWWTVKIIGGGNWRTQRKPPTCHKVLTNKQTKRHQKKRRGGGGGEGK